VPFVKAGSIDRKRLCASCVKESDLFLSLVEFSWNPPAVALIGISRPTSQHGGRRYRTGGGAFQRWREWRSWQRRIAGTQTTRRDAGGRSLRSQQAHSQGKSFPLNREHTEGHWFLAHRSERDLSPSISSGWLDTDMTRCALCSLFLSQKSSLTQSLPSTEYTRIMTGRSPEQG